MIAELIKLSKELYELDMVDESICVDEMIHKLYGIGSIGPEPELDLEEEGFHKHNYPQFIAEEILANSHKQEFISTFASIIYESLEEDSVKKLIKELIDYLE